MLAVIDNFRFNHSFTFPLWHEVLIQIHTKDQTFQNFFSNHHKHQKGYFRKGYFRNLETVSGQKMKMVSKPGLFFDFSSFFFSKNTEKQKIKK